MSDMNDTEDIIVANIDNFFIRDSEMSSDNNDIFNIKNSEISLDNNNNNNCNLPESELTKIYKKNNKQIELNKIILEGLNATTGMKLINEIPSNKYSNSESENSLDDKEPGGKSNMIDNMLKSSDINGWDNDANITIKNWYHTFKQQSFIYQWVLDKNHRIAERYALTSIMSSGMLSIFSGFTLWVPTNLFHTISTIIIIVCNFLIALLTALSRTYGNDTRTDAIRNYVREIDEFLGEISAQVLKSPVYRMNADEFFKQTNDTYTKLIISAPNMTLSELNQSKKEYKIYMDNIEYVSVV